jgi:hypothetical protein
VPGPTCQFWLFSPAWPRIASSSEEACPEITKNSAALETVVQKPIKRVEEIFAAHQINKCLRNTQKIHCSAYRRPVLALIKG